MHHKNSNTALILFTRTAAEEAKAKKFSYHVGKKGNELIAGKLIANAIKIAKNSGVDFFLFTEKEQISGAFGDRLAHAYQQVFNKGYERVISIGNDSPSMDLMTIMSAIEDLEKHDLVIGPAKDGGVYLLGMHKSLFELRTFSRLKWKTDRLIEDILENLSVKGNSRLLHTLADIDHARDLSNFLLYSVSELSHHLKALLLSFQSQWYGTHINTYLGKLEERKVSHRGPPTA